MKKNETLIAMKKIIYPVIEEKPDQLPVVAKYEFTNLPFAKLDSQGIKVFSAIIANLKDRDNEIVEISSSELSRITGIQNKQRIHQKLVDIVKNFEYINVVTFKERTENDELRGFLSLFDTFSFSEEYKANFILKVRLGQTFQELVNYLGEAGNRYFGYDINILRLLPSRSFDGLLYIFLSAESIKSRHGVVITRDDFIDKLGVPVSKVNDRQSGIILKKGLEELQKKGIIEQVRVERIDQETYKVYYSLIKTSETLLDYMKNHDKN